MNSSAGHVHVAVDVGGTFIDFVAHDELTGKVTIEKQPSTPDALVDELLTGMERLDVPLGDLARIFHGTTAGINALVQERGARVGLLMTEGFRDVLEIGRGRRPEVYNTLYAPPSPLVPRHLRRGVRERLAADGTVLVPLQVDDLDAKVDYLLGAGAQAIAVCFLHSYREPAHEREAAARIRERHPGIPVSLSHEVATEWREFERASTTVINAYIQPLLDEYVRRLDRGLAAGGFERSIAMMQSNGGVMSAAATVRRPVKTLLSGPAGGVIGAQTLARELELENLICADVGGTTYDVALIEDSAVVETTETEVGGRPIVGPSIDIVSIGAGGGSIAWIDESGAVQVGPQSAGAVPGPAAYAQGGTMPTVTDCQLVLGRMAAEGFLGARMRLDMDAAGRAIREHIAAPTGFDIEPAAMGVLRIAETNMTYAIRTLTVERGLDPRDFALCSYGGGGGLFAAEVAEELGISTVVVPAAAANFSAAGILGSDYREDAARTNIQPLIAESVPGVLDTLEELEAHVVQELEGFGFAHDESVIGYRLDVRYLTQDDTITVELDRSWLGDADTLLRGVRRRFVSQHNRLFGYGEPDEPLEVVTFRARGTGRVVSPGAPSPETKPPGRSRATREVWFTRVDRPLDTDIFDRAALAAGQEVSGPAIVEEWNTTTLIPPGWTTRVHDHGHMILRRGGSA